MILFRKLQFVLLFGLFGFGLSGCGDSNDGSSSSENTETIAPAEVVSGEVMKKDATNENIIEGELQTYDPDVPSMVVEDNGVVHEEVIYNAWPEQAASTVGDSESMEQTEEAPAAVGAKTHTVNGRATSFSPNIIFINPGDTVQWENMTIHDSVSMEGLIPEGAEPWTFKIGQNGAVTLTEEGVYIYKCNPHYPLGMVAAIIVGKPVNVEQVQANATGRSKGIVIKVVKALAAQ